jgi:DNA polymerase-3 subunit epsilon
MRHTPPQREVISCFLDTETTGLDAQKSGIWQIAGIIYIPHKDPIEFNYHLQPFPSDLIDPGAAKVAGFDSVDAFKKKLQEYERPQETFRTFKRLLRSIVSPYNKFDKIILYGWNVKFDENFLRAWWQKNDDSYFGSWFFSPSIDVASLAAEFFRTSRHTGETNPNGLTLHNFKLETVAAFCGISGQGEYHDALVDVKVTRDIYCYVIEEGLMLE